MATPNIAGVWRVDAIEVRVDWRMDAAVWDGAFASWLDGVASPHTRTAYSLSVQQFVCWKRDLATWRAAVGKRGKRGAMPREQVSRSEPWSATISDVEHWRNAMTQAGLSAATIGNRLAALSAFFDYCRTKVVRLNGMTPEPLVMVNPVDGVDRPRIAPRKRVVLTVAQVRSLIRRQPQTTLVGLRNRSLLLCYLFTGLRNSEIRHLRWGDIREDDEGRAFVFWTGKGQTGDECQIRPAVLTALRDYLGAAGRLPGVGDDEYIFIPLSDEAGRLPNVEHDPARPLSRQRINAIIKACSKKAGLNSAMITTHTLRRTAARRFYEASGYDIERTREMLHHSLVETTVRYVNEQREDPDMVWQTVEEWYGL